MEELNRRKAENLKVLRTYGFDMQLRHIYGEITRKRKHGKIKKKDYRLTKTD